MKEQINSSMVKANSGWIRISAQQAIKRRWIIKNSGKIAFDTTNKKGRKRFVCKFMHMKEEILMGVPTL